MHALHYMVDKEKEMDTCKCFFLLQKFVHFKKKGQLELFNNLKRKQFEFEKGKTKKKEL